MILVTGATGLVGRHLITTLRGDGAEVRALSRRPGTAGLPYGVRVVGGELGDPASPAPALTGVEAVYLFSAGRTGRGFALRHWGDMIRHQGVVRAPYPDAAAEHAGDFR